MYQPPEFGQNRPTFTPNYADDKRTNIQTNIQTNRQNKPVGEDGPIWIITPGIKKISKSKKCSRMTSDDSQVFLSNFEKNFFFPLEKIFWT